MACGIATTTTRLKSAELPVLWEKAHQSRSRTSWRSRAAEEPRAPRQAGQKLQHVLSEAVPDEWQQTLQEPLPSKRTQPLQPAEDKEPTSGRLQCRRGPNHAHAHARTQGYSTPP